VANAFGSESGTTHIFGLGSPDAMAISVVPRITPDILKLAEIYKRSIDAFYRFVFVGRTDGIPRYYAAVRALAIRFKMLPERFLFVGAVTDWELAAYYRSASVYLSLSEHEVDATGRLGAPWFVVIQNRYPDPQTPVAFR